MENADNNVKNNLIKVKSLVATHKIIKGTPCGGKETFEKHLEYSQSKKMFGDHWLWEPSRPDRDAPKDHFRHDNTTILVRTGHTLEMKNGTQITDQHATKKEDEQKLYGTSMIANEPDRTPDKRPALLSGFSSAGQSELPLLIKD